MRKELKEEDVGEDERRLKESDALKKEKVL